MLQQQKIFKLEPDYFDRLKNSQFTEIYIFNNYFLYLNKIIYYRISTGSTSISYLIDGKCCRLFRKK